MKCSSTTVNRSSRAKPSTTLRLCGRHRHRVAVVDHQRLDARPEPGRGLAQQIVADGAHVDDARLPHAQQVGPLQRGIVAYRREPARGRQQQAAGAVAPGAHQAGQQRDQAHGIAAAVHALHAVVQADRRRPRRAVVVRQRAHLFGVEAAHRGGALRRPLQRTLAQRRPAVAHGAPGSRGRASRCGSARASGPAPARRRCPAAAPGAHGTCRPSRCAAGRCTPAWRRRAWPACAKVQKCRFEAIELLPQMRISRLSAKCSRCMPTLAP